MPLSTVQHMCSWLQLWQLSTQHLCHCENFLVSLRELSCDPICLCLCRNPHIALSKFCLSSILFYNHSVQSASYVVICRVNLFDVTQRPSKATCSGLSCAGSRLRQRAEPVQESLNAYLELIIISCAGLGEAPLAIASVRACA